MSGVIGESRNFYTKFKFVVEADGIAVAAFTKAGPLEAEVAVIEVNEGGSLIPHKQPGRAKFSNLVLERGATDDRDLYTWFLQVVDAAANKGEKEPTEKKTLDIVQQERDGSTRARYRVFNAFPVKFKAGEWDNDADEVVMESVELAYDYFEIVPAGA